jgi:hypothetical protein
MLCGYTQLRKTTSTIWRYVMQKKKLLINIFGPPKAGKTTLMSSIFTSLKIDGVYCEMVADFPKGVLFEENTSVLKNQLYIFAMQEKRISDLYKYADVVITDSPLLHSLVYNTDEYKTLHPFIKETHNKFNNLNLALKRIKDVKYGSFKMFSEEELNKIESDIFYMLEDYPYHYIPCTIGDINNAIEIVKTFIKENTNE